LTKIIAALLFMKPLSLIEVTTAIMPQWEQLILKHLLKLKNFKTYLVWGLRSALLFIFLFQITFFCGIYVVILAIND
jgi:hypothetical protein